MNLFDRGKQLNETHARIMASLLQLDALTRNGIHVELVTFTTYYGHVATYLTELGEAMHDVTQLQQGQTSGPGPGAPTTTGQE